jgi:hypothetical protein
MRPMNEIHDDEDTGAASWAGGVAVTAGILLVLAAAQAVF